MEQSESYQKVERRIKEMEHQLSMSDHAIQACEQSGERREMNKLVILTQIIREGSRRGD